MSCKPRINKFKSLIGVSMGGFLSFAAICTHRGDDSFYSNLLMPFVTRFVDPELAHDACIMLTKYGLIKCQENLSQDQAHRLETNLFGLKFTNPIGVAAGFDKDCQAAHKLSNYGLGFAEVGTVTPNAQPGNPKKRIFRGIEHQALVNRCGFNSSGLKTVISNIEARTFRPIILGLNLGKNKKTIDISSDYIIGLESSKDLEAVDYIVINISSPNTPFLRQTQDKDKLEKLLDDILKLKAQLSINKPLLLKIAPDLTDQQKKDIAKLVLHKRIGKHQIDGLILTNTTLTRPLDVIHEECDSTKVLLKEVGGLSGKPLRDMSTQMISDFYKLTDGRVPIIGVGGIFTGEDAYEKIKSGASLVQIYTALTYEGPPIVNRIKQELAVLLERDGFKSVAEAVGHYHKKGAKSKWWYSSILLLYTILLGISSKEVDCSLAMKRLYEDLFSDYNRLILPVANNRSKVTVTLGLKLGQILDLNLKQQILSTNVWVEQSWFDYKLTWNPQKYQGIDMIHVPAENIWIPDIVLFNNADGNYELTMMTKAKVFYNGSVVWKPPTMYRSTCEIDVEYFPFDVQMCLLRFGSWTYAGDEVELKHVDQRDKKVDIGIDLTEFHKNVEWDIIEVPASYNEEFYDCCTEPYPDITFKIVIRRKILFYMVNLILPTAVMAFMTIFVFYLPSKSDEKVTLSISILISLIVFFLLMLEIIPASSLAVPLFGKYLLFTLVLVLTSTCVTVFVLNIHYRSPSVDTMSPLTRKIFLETLPWWLGINRPDIKERSSLARFRKKKAKKLLSSTNKIYDSSMTNNDASTKQQHPLSIGKLSDPVEDSEDDNSEDDQGRYFRRHIDKYRNGCRLHDNTEYQDPDDSQSRLAGRNSRQKTPVSSLRHRSTPTMFTSLDSTTELKSLPICRCCSGPMINRLANTMSSNPTIGQQQIDDNNNSSIRSKQHNCTLSTVRQPLNSCIPNEDTLDMTFDYDDELPTPPPPPPPPLPPSSQRPSSKVSLNNNEDNQHQLLTTASTRSGFLEGTTNHQHHQMVSVDVSSSSNEQMKDDSKQKRISSIIKQQHTVDSSINDEDDDSNNGKSESIQSSILNHMIQGSTLDARLLLDSSIDNNDSGQTILTRQADSCTCCDPMTASARFRSMNEQQQQQHQTPSSYIRRHPSSQLLVAGRTAAPTHNNQLNYNISSNYSSTTAATIPPPPPTLQSTLPSHQYFSSGANNIPCNNGDNGHSLNRAGVNEFMDCCGGGGGLSADAISSSRFTNQQQQQQQQHIPPAQSSLQQPSSLLMSLKLPYDQMPPHVKAAIRSILFIADTIKNEDVENRAVEDWNFMSMVVDRLFLWIFSVLCLLGSFMLLMFAPSLYDNRPSIDDILRVDIPLSNCSAVIRETVAA